MAGANIRGLMGKGVPPTPTFFSILRVAVMVLSLAVLAACAYNLSLLGGQASYAGPPGFMLFVSLFTLIILGGAMALERFAPQFYFRLALLIAYGVNVLFWLSGWAWSASIASLFLGNTCIGSTCFGPTTEETRYGASMAAAAGVGAVNWVMMIVVLFYFVKGCLADPDCYGISTGHGAEMGSLSLKAEGKQPSRSSNSE
ncbi:hypothetical protein CGCF415_v000641 [Colletotrichum fructicola]|uniref:MARVEL domain-containing protein n=2 Tax=Colletotrichum gloeosporioides species complex TaxID=2707338 RepID=L2FD97_COLFN|nr:uncharacterized protein CGMCC3_g3574 [Colletotrichum fructicola]XP_053029744.1 uncharacterized protein COL26b_013728 [Colletotrichum chrysophilum]KAF4486637.1 hypothetical protein CGGC5_v005569 [Colletotrichum fructicola Nara gc5]KAF4816659.1 hypothetical protein CGCSCA5_v006364 [Colletotrichum siamense]KAI8150820.1 hypothetical protein K4K50_011705 [Colletotrichum sp. SAR 10_71]KAI8151464.1 hypothetical protein KHU50_012083 [Colletotrichum sp. SAR 10_65]KAI8187847.1 hypothetical protein K